jgi:hypothetical protein
MYVDHDYRSKRYVPGGSVSHDALRDDRGLALRLALSAMPLMGLVLGVVGMALWNAG